MSLPQFYPIFDRVEWFERLVPLGIEFVQIRVKDRPLEQVREEIQAAKAICDRYGTTLVVNDYWELAIELGCTWVHLGQEDMETADRSAIREAGLKLGLSTHDPDELDRALAWQPDYVALGPVYPTRLKKMKWHQQGLERVSEWKTRVGTLPLVGIGGISVERAPGVLAAGADLVSVVTDITWNPDPEQRVKAWLSATRRDS